MIRVALLGSDLIGQVVENAVAGDETDRAALGQVGQEDFRQAGFEPVELGVPGFVLEAENGQGVFSGLQPGRWRFFAAASEIPEENHGDYHGRDGRHGQLGAAERE